MMGLLATIRFVALCMVPASVLGLAAALIWHRAPGWGWFLVAATFVLRGWITLEDGL